VRSDDTAGGARSLEDPTGSAGGVQGAGRLSREKDTQTLRYDWFINEDGTECEVHEAYVSGQGLIEHNTHIIDARALLFERYAYDHRMTAFGEVSQELRELANKHAGGIAVWSFLHGLGTAATV
jgi:hypothetical protein